MILVRMARDKLDEQIEAEKRGWAKRAKKKNAAAAKSKDGIWSEIKGVFMRRQCFKCIYCERRLAKIDGATTAGISVEYDVEHFRPKNRVTPWPKPDVAKRHSLDQSKIKKGASGGYPSLAHEPGNYVVSCKHCNSVWKQDRFPIAGKASKAKGVAKLNATEKPLLLFPFGDDGDDPDHYFVHQAILMFPKPKRGHERLRAQVTIAFFELNLREDLLRSRAEAILLLSAELDARATAKRAGRKRRVTSIDLVAALTADDASHTACVRAFEALHGTAPALAKKIRDVAARYVESSDTKVAKLLAKVMSTR